jgi:hypothetical protein
MKLELERSGLAGREECDGHRLGDRPVRPIVELIEDVDRDLQAAAVGSPSLPPQRARVGTRNTVMVIALRANVL